MTKTWITKTYKRDEEALTAIAKCGHIRTEHFKNCKIADKRLRNYVKDNLIEKTSYYNSKNNNFEDGYKLTARGRQFVEDHFSFQRSNMQVAQSPNHDFGIADKYFSISDSERESWRTETQLRDQFNEELQRLKETDISLYNKIKEMNTSTPDASYTTIDGVEIVYEVVTNSYSKDEIEAKENHTRIIGGEINYGYR